MKTNSFSFCSALVVTVLLARTPVQAEDEKGGLEQISVLKASGKQSISCQYLVVSMKHLLATAPCAESLSAEGNRLEFRPQWKSSQLFS